MIIDTDKIQELLNSDVTSYKIAKNAFFSSNLIDGYRKGKLKIENMSLRIAIELMEFINKNVDKTENA